MRRGAAVLTAAAGLLAAAGAVEPPAQLEKDLRAARPGGVVVLGFSAGNSVPALNAFPNRLETQGGTLVYSDDPETATANGILYRDTTAAGLTRVYLYHVNGTGTARRFALVLENPGTETAQVSVARRALRPPSGDYTGVGKAASREFLQAPVLMAPLALAPGQAVLADAAINASAVSTNQLLHAIHDVTSDKPLRVATVMMSSGTDVLSAYPGLGMAPDDGMNREGTFTGTTRSRTGAYTYDTASGIRRVRIADGGEFDTDPPLAGRDADTGATVRLRGNYGVGYDVPISVRASDGRRLAVLLNPRGGGYGGFVRTTFDGVATEAMVPDTTSSLVPVTTHGGVCALVSPGTEARTLRLELTPAGASSLAIDVLLVPFEGTGNGWVVR